MRRINGSIPRTPWGAHRGATVSGVAYAGDRLREPSVPAAACGAIIDRHTGRPDPAPFVYSLARVVSVQPISRTGGLPSGKGFAAGRKQIDFTVEAFIAVYAP